MAEAAPVSSRRSKKVRRKKSHAAPALATQADKGTQRSSDALQNKSSNSVKQKKRKKGKNSKCDPAKPKEVNQALSVFEKMLEPHEKNEGRFGAQLSGAIAKAVFVGEPDELKKDKSVTPGEVALVSAGARNHVKKLKKGKRKRCTVEDGVVASSGKPRISVSSDVKTCPPTSVWVNDVISEDSDVDMQPEEEKSKALSVMAQVLAQDDNNDEMSEEEPLEKKTPLKSRKVFIGNLPWKVDADTVQEDWEKYGEIDSFSMPLNKQTGKPMGVAFIVYANAEGVERALTQNETTYGGRKLRVSLADADATSKTAKKVVGDDEKSKDQSGKENGTVKVHAADIEKELDKWVQAKRNRDFETSDAIRQQLRSRGIDADQERGKDNRQGKEKGSKGKGKSKGKGGKEK